MKINIDYLDVLYRWKEEADIVLSEFIEKYKDYAWSEDEPEEKIKYEIRLENLRKTASLCGNGVRVYLSWCNN